MTRKSLGEWVQLDYLTKSNRLWLLIRCCSKMIWPKEKYNRNKYIQMSRKVQMLIGSQGFIFLVCTFLWFCFVTIKFHTFNTVRQINITPVRAVNTSLSERWKLWKVVEMVTSVNTERISHFIHDILRCRR